MSFKLKSQCWVDTVENNSIYTYEYKIDLSLHNKFFLYVFYFNISSNKQRSFKNKSNNSPRYSKW